MGTLLGLALLFCVFILPGILTSAKFDNRLPPEGYKVDYGEYYVNLETGEIESTELHSRLVYKNIGKYAICTDCGKRLFKVDDNLNVID